MGWFECACGFGAWSVGVHGQSWVYLAFWLFSHSFIVFFWPKYGFASVKNTGFYSIPAGPSDHFSENALLGQNVIIYSIFMPQRVA